MDSELNKIIKGCMADKQKYQELLYKQFYSYGMSVSLRYAKNKEEAVEILNDGYLKVFNNLKSFNTDKEFKPWFRQILVNTAIDYFRKKNKSNIWYEEEINFDPEPDVLNNLNAEDILKLLSQLPELYRITFNMHEIEGYKHEEIAKMLNIAESSSRVNLVRAKKMLREAFVKHFQLEYYEAI